MKMGVVKEPCFKDLNVGECFIFPNHRYVYMKVGDRSHFSFDSNRLCESDDIKYLEVQKVTAKLTWSYE
jgi:hypothetical protein